MNREPEPYINQTSLTQGRSINYTKYIQSNKFKANVQL